MRYFPDVEAAIFDRLKGIGGEFAVSFDSQFRTGDPDVQYTIQQTAANVSWPFVQEEALVQIDTRCRSSKKKARDAAYQARDSLLQWRHEIPGTAPRVAVVSGPFWLPEPDGEPRYVMTVAVTVREKQDAARTEAVHG